MLKSNSMVDFFERLGHKVIRTQSSWWYDVQSGVFLTIPYYKEITPSEEEIGNLMKSEKLRALRYPTTLDSLGFLSNITVNTNSNYDISSLHQKARNQTRRGLENCKVEQLDFDWLIDNGLPLNISTAKRQGRESHYSNPIYWAKYCQAAKATEGVSAWGAFIEDQLAAFLISVTTENNWQEWVVNHSLTQLRNKYSNNALSFTVAQQFLKNEKSNGICYGLGSLEETGQLDHFKSRMGWTVRPIKQRLIFSKKLKLVFSLAQEPSLKLLNMVFPKNYTVCKLTNMIRFYRQQTYNIPSETQGNNLKQ